MLQIEELTKHYKQGKTVVRALDGITLGVEDAEFVAVVGRSGSGKSTLLDCLGLLLKPTGGRVVIDGVDTSRTKDDARARLRVDKIGFVFQEYNLLPALDALENVMLPLTYARRAKADDAWARRLLAEVGLADRRHHSPAQMSGGEQQRVAIARALVNRPSMVLADEPTGAVDTETSDQLAAIMRRMNRQHGVTFVIVTHDPELAAKADRIIRLKDGRVLSDETAAPREVAV